MKDILWNGLLGAQNGITVAERSAEGVLFPWPTPKPMMFHVQVGVHHPPRRLPAGPPVALCAAYQAHPLVALCASWQAGPQQSE